MFAEEIPSQFGDGIGVDAFWRGGCSDKASQIIQHSLGYFCLCRKHRQRTNYISICLHVHLQPGCFAYVRKPPSVVSASKRMERWEAFALSGPMALHIGSICITPEDIEIDVFLSIRS